MPRKKKDVSSQLATIADKLWEARQERLELNRKVRLLETEEKEYRDQLAAALEEHDMSAVGGKLCHVKRERVPKPQINDWEKFYKFIAKNDAFDMLYRRLNEKAVEERVAGGEKIGGLEQVWVNKLSVHKV